MLTVQGLTSQASCSQPHQHRPISCRQPGYVCHLLSPSTQVWEGFKCKSPKQHAWLQKAAGGPQPALRIVSLHADLTNRGPTFDMDLSELEHDGQPITYEEAQQYFKRDPAHRSVCLLYVWLSRTAPDFSCCALCLQEQGMGRLQDEVQCCCILCSWVACVAGAVSALVCRHDRLCTMILSVPATSAAPRGLTVGPLAFDLIVSAWLLRSWAAYVAGALVVLMRERGMRFADGLSILISSAVPEGKGVSSSAAVEVATMQALTAAQGLALDGRDLALLCQKVDSSK